jgi:hypothetical protein
MARLVFWKACALRIIRHANKPGGYRDSSAIKGAVDLMVRGTSADCPTVESR